MMRKVVMTASALVLLSSAVFSQSQLDAYKYVSNELTGTARYLGMGGAFGALGGDVSAMNTNPAGLAVYKSSEVVGTISLSSVNTKTNWLGTAESNNRTKFSFDNMAYVGYFPTGNDEGLLSWNVGFSYNRLKNYTREYSMTAVGGTNYSLSDYVALRATKGGIPVNDLILRENEYDPYNALGDWLVVLGYEAGYIDAYKDNDKLYHSTFSDKDGTPYEIDKNRLRVRESGALDQYNLAFGMNFSDRIMVGATVAITDMDYNYESFYAEDFTNKNYLDLGLNKGGMGNGLNTNGTGYAFNLGVIVRPADFLRLGVAYNSPTWYKMTDYYHSGAATNVNYFDKAIEVETPNNAYTKYEYRSPDKWLFSAAAIIGQSALISVDYELLNYKNMRMYYDDGSPNLDTNYDIKNSFGIGNTLRVGAEYKVTPQFSVRAGGSWATSSVKKELKNGDMEVYTVGTIPNYTIDKGVTNYTVGLGYRFTPNFYADIACIFRTQKEDAYAFSSIWLDKEDLDPDAPKVISQSASLKTNTTRVALTLGYKF